LKTDRMILGHGGTHDQNGVRICEILLSSGRAAASNGCAQTGHG
jgi:hypothetical protein